MMTCKQCQNHVVRYVHNELPPSLFRRVAQHISQCETCYRIYIEHRGLANELRHVVQLANTGRPPSFERVWAASQAEALRRTSNYYPLRYGMFMLGISILLLVPFAFGGSNQVLAEPPTQPAPLLRTAPNVTPPTDNGIAVAFEISQTPVPAKLPSISLPLDVISTP